MGTYLPNQLREWFNFNLWLFKKPNFKIEHSVFKLWLQCLVSDGFDFIGHKKYNHIIQSHKVGAIKNS